MDEEQVSTEPEDQAKKPPADWPPLDLDEEVGEIPPKVDPLSLAMRQEVALEQGNAESMPVLAAFQQFLEAERIRSRNRMITLSVAFGVVLAILLIAGVVVSISVLRPVQREFESLQSEIGNYQRQSERESGRVDTMLDRFHEQDRRFQDQLLAERQSHAETRTQLSVQEKAVQADLAHVQKLVNDLQNENLQLKRNLKHVQTDLPELLGEVRDTLRGIGEGTSAATKPAGAATAPAMSGPLVLSIIPEGSTRALTWRLPVPE